MMGKLSRDKGKRGELEAAELIRRFGFEARRGQQFRGGPGSPDVAHSIPGVHVEVKRTERLALYPALEQAAEDTPFGGKPVVLHRPSRKDWVAVMYAGDLLFLLRELMELREGAEKAENELALHVKSLERAESALGLDVVQNALNEAMIPNGGAPE